MNITLHNGLIHCCTAVQIVCARANKWTCYSVLDSPLLYLQIPLETSTILGAPPGLRMSISSWWMDCVGRIVFVARPGNTDVLFRAEILLHQEGDHMPGRMTTMKRLWLSASRKPLATAFPRRGSWHCVLIVNCDYMMKCYLQDPSVGGGPLVHGRTQAPFYFHGSIWVKCVCVYSHSDGQCVFSAWHLKLFFSWLGLWHLSVTLTNVCFVIHRLIVILIVYSLWNLLHLYM